MQCNRKLVG